MENLSIERKIGLVLLIEEAKRTKIDIYLKDSMQGEADHNCNLCEVNLNSKYVHVSASFRKNGESKQVQDYDLCCSCYNDIMNGKWDLHARAFAA